MRVCIVNFILIICLPLLISSTLFSAETIALTQQVTESVVVEGRQDQKKVSNQTLYIAPQRIRLDHTDGSFLLLDFDKDMLYDVDTLLKNYQEKDIRNFEQKWQKANEILLKQVEGVPENHPRRGELIDQLSDGPSKWNMIWKLPAGKAKDDLLAKYNLTPEPPVVTVEKTTEKKLIAGYECQLFRVLENGKLRSFAWVAPDVPLEKDLAEFLRVTGIVEENIAKELSKIRGFPLEYAMFWRDGRLEHTVTAASEKKNLDKDFFEVPKGFVKEQGRSGF